MFGPMRRGRYEVRFTGRRGYAVKFMRRGVMFWPRWNRRGSTEKFTIERLKVTLRYRYLALGGKGCQSVV
jgi:hypothetical protein